MLLPRQPILEALATDKAAFLAGIDSAIAGHDRHANVTASEGAYKACMKMARTLRAAKAHIEADDIDAVCSDLSAYCMITEITERVARANRFKRAA